MYKGFPSLATGVLDQLFANELVVISPVLKLTVTVPGPAEATLIPLKSELDLL